MITFALANQKGGVGKTTSAVNIAAALGLKCRVLLIDLDAQASATLWLTDSYGVSGRVAYNVLTRTATIRDCATKTGAGVDLVPSDLVLAQADIDLTREINGEMRLAKALAAVQESYDVCLIDCPPNLGMCSLNAIAASDTVIIPVDCKPMAFISIATLVDTVVAVSEEYERPIGLLALPTFYERTTIARDVLAAIKERFDQSGMLPPIHKNTRLVEAFLARQTIFDYDKSALGAVDYTRVAKELLNDLPQVEIRGGARQSR